MAFVLAFVGFVFGTAVVLALAAAAGRLPQALVRRRVERRMEDVKRGFVPEPARDEAALIKTAPEGPLPALDRLAGRVAAGNALSRLIEQAGVRAGASAVLLLALVLGLLGVATGMITGVAWAPLAGLAAGLVAPFLVLRYVRGRRFRRFEEQFPEALDLVARAVRAGHAFTTGLKMVADEVADPVGPEFRKTFEEQNYGLPLKDALNNLASRVPILDVRFFATAVLIQRETGGNLAEILDNLAHVVRERFKILRQVRVHTAHGRLTGYVLLALPAALAVALTFINPEHMNLLFRERVGRMLLSLAVVMQLGGYFWIKRIVKIEV